MTDPPDEPRLRSIYRGGYFPRVRERWGEYVREARFAARHPLQWLRGTLKRDADFALRAVDRTLGGFGAALRHPTKRRWVLGGFALLGFLPAFAWERCGVMGCPDVGRVATLQPGGAAVVYDAEGGVLGRLTPVRWEVVRLARLPRHVAQAFVAVEDQRFYGHHGVDWRRFLGTTARNLMPGGRSQGASTITMQVARNVFPDRLPASERTIRRKVLEIRVAMEIEDRYSKDQILQTYLNQIYFGEGVYGIESAARIYFGKHASALTLPEAALLAGLPKAPTTYNPRRNPDRSVTRRNLVLGLMAQQGRITPEQRDAARGAGLRLARLETRRERRRAPYFVEQVRRILEDRLGQELYTGALRIRTGLDPRAQAAAEAQLEAQIKRVEGGAFGRFTAPKRAAFRGGAETPYLQGSAVLLDARTGDVRAWVGGRAFEESGFDRIAGGFRQPGSAFKPFVFAAALRSGVALTDTLIDAPLRRDMPGGDVWEPRNFDGRFRGPVTVRNALRWSVNTVAVRLAERAGLDDVRGEARRMGITSEIPALPSVAIGAAAVKPLELVRAYTAYANLGTRVEPRFVTRVENGAGEVLWEPAVRRRRVVDPGVAFLVTDALRDVIDRGTGRKARDVGLRGPAAGKTGTTNGATDAWFVGYTPDLVGSVWIGFDRPRPIAARGSGGELAAPVWGRLVRAAAGGRVPEEWGVPGGVVERSVAFAGLRVIEPGCRARGDAYDEYFLRSAVPPAVCPRGTARGGGLEEWWNRATGALEAQVGEWVREKSAEAWREVKRRAGISIRSEPAPRTPRRAEDRRGPEPRDPEPREPAGVSDPVTPGPRDTIFLPDVPVDTIRIPSAESG
ncbi:MAG TPA: PBP1A family penicillin-binding protein [Longimicrobium sp.]|jgi:penicillin-binding protein 1A